MRIKIHTSVAGPPNSSMEDSLYTKGFKNTKGRKIILNELENRKEHFNAESLYSGLTQNKRRVSKPTIYRTLKLLEKLRLVERFDIKQNCFYYEPVLNGGEHGHLICEECGKILDFSMEGFSTLKSAIGKEKGFALGYLSVRAFGLCQNCQQAMKTPGEET